MANKFVRLLCLCAVWSGLLAPAGYAYAQEIAAKTTVGIVHSGQTVTVNMEAQPLLHVLKTIAQQARLTPMYPVEIENHPAQVSLHVRNVPVTEAFNKVLFGTGWVASIVSDKVLFERDRRGLAEVVHGNIVGKVLDVRTKAPIGGASVTLGTSTNSITTDQNGTFRIEGVSAGAGEHRIVVRMLGYPRTTRLVNVRDSVTTTVEVVLEPSVSALDQVIVTGTVMETSMREIPNAMTVITAKQLEERGITKIEQLFRGDVPGLFALNQGTAAPLDAILMYSRGATSMSTGGSSLTMYNTNPIKTYLDGVELASPEHMNQIDPKTIERIEIIAGPQASTLYGANAINGVMQIFTKRGQTSRAGLLAGWTSGFTQNNYSRAVAPNHSANVQLSGMEGRLGYSLHTSWQFIGSWSPAVKKESINASGSVRTDLLPNLSADASARRTHAKNLTSANPEQPILEACWRGLIRSDYYCRSYVVTHVENKMASQTFQISLSYRPFTWWSHTLGVGMDESSPEGINNRGNFNTPADSTKYVGGSSSSSRSESYSTSLQMPVTRYGVLRLVMGGDHRRSYGSEWSGTPSEEWGWPLNNPTMRVNRPGKNMGIYMQGQLAVQEVFFVTYGMRLELNPSVGEDAVMLPGRYGASYVRDFVLYGLETSVKFRGSYGRSIRPTSEMYLKGMLVYDKGWLDQFGEFYQVLPNSELVNESQQGGEGGVDIYFGNILSLSITRYNQTVNDLVYNVPDVDSIRSVTVTPNPSYCWNDSRDEEGRCFALQAQHLNAGSLRNQGWELQQTATVGPFMVRGTYSWNTSRVIGITEKYRDKLAHTAFQPGRSFDFMPEHTWSAGVGYSNANTSLQLSANGVGMRYVGGLDAPLNIFNSSAGCTSMRTFHTCERFRPADGYRPQSPGYTQFHATASRHLSSSLEVNLQINNLADSYRYDLGGSYAVPGRVTTFGIRWRMR